MWFGASEDHFGDCALRTLFVKYVLKGRRRVKSLEIRI